jgi:hypothetical protein
MCLLSSFKNINQDGEGMTERRSRRWGTWWKKVQEMGDGIQVYSSFHTVYKRWCPVEGSSDEHLPRFTQSDHERESGLGSDQRVIP